MAAGCCRIYVHAASFPIFTMGFLTRAPSHSNFIQIAGAASANGIHATLLNDVDLVPLEYDYRHAKSPENADNAGDQTTQPSTPEATDSQTVVISNLQLFGTTIFTLVRDDMFTVCRRKRRLWWLFHIGFRRSRGSWRGPQLQSRHHYRAQFATPTSRASKHPPMGHCASAARCPDRHSLPSWQLPPSAADFSKI
ncbi:hypothetical protein B0H12DRAFT_234867 [Mycena haematopus]|nr:hypothetical protein B0H12DRAFT_234867 [Mycena haematopus]